MSSFGTPIKRPASQKEEGGFTPKRNNQRQLEVLEGIKIGQGNFDTASALDRVFKISFMKTSGEGPFTPACKDSNMKTIMNDLAYGAKFR
jgi:hypothetical protein